MRRNAFIGFLLVLALSGQAWAQPAIDTIWQKCLGGSQPDEGAGIVHTTDGGFAVVGSTQSNDGQVMGHHGGEDIWVVKIDANGNFQWQKCLGGSGTDYGYAIVQTNDGGYAVAGETLSSDGDVTGSGYHGGGDAWVVKLNDTGGIQWKICIGGSQEDVAYSIIQTSDNGFVIAGQTFSSDGDMSHSQNFGAADAFVAKLNSAGIFQWEKNYGGSDDDGASSIIQTFDGGFALAGWTASTNSGEVTKNNGGATDEWIVNLDDTGAINWSECLGGSGDDWANSLVQTNDGGFAVAGYTTSNDKDVSGNHGGNNGTEDVWVVKLDLSGEIKWQKCLGGSAVDRGYSIVQTSDGGYAVAGLTYSNDGNVTGNFGTKDGLEWVVKLNDTGAIQWQKCLGGTEGDQANSIIQIPGGNYVVAGTTASNDSDVTGDHGGLDAWVVKLGNPDPPIISYITPDAGAPGMCVAVDIVGPNSDTGDFGVDNQDFQGGRPYLVQLAKQSDTTLVKLGPGISSWKGRIIQQMIFINPGITKLDTSIQLEVVINGQASAPFTFHILAPRHVGTLSGGGVIGSNIRTPANTMVVDSMILTNGTYSCPQTDPDPNTPGNQSYLPLRILSMGPIELSNATLSANGFNGTTGTGGGNGGPGGGGGGSGYPGAGGTGYTGGGGDNDGSNGPGGTGTGSVTGSSAWTGGSGLSGATGGNGEQHSGSGQDDGGGGGTGHPFGTSGQNGGPSTSPAGGYGAGSAGGSSGPPTYSSNYGGGGGGNQTAGAQGQGTGNNGGKAVGNQMLIPFSGGSGGGAGNQTYVSLFGSSQGGCGGGGGGAIELTSFASFSEQGSHLTAQGGNGSNAVPKVESAAAGGGGSGGAISVSARDSVVIDATSNFSVTGGIGGTSSSSNSNGGTGGAGRVRVDGYVSKFTSPSSANYFLQSNGYTGPSIQSVTFGKNNTFVVSGHGASWDGSLETDSGIVVYMTWPSLEGGWTVAFGKVTVDPASHTASWSTPVTGWTPNGAADSEIYFVAGQESSLVNSYLNGTLSIDTPIFVMGHTSGIIVKVTGPRNDSIQPMAVNFGDELVGKCSDDTTIEIYSTGISPLVVDSAKLLGRDAPQFKIVTTPPISVPHGDSLAFMLQFCPDSVKCPMAATLRVYMNDTTKDITLSGCGVQPDMIINPLVINFGRVHIGDCKDTLVTVSDTGKNPLTITSESFGNSQFKIVGTLPIIVPAGGSTPLEIQFCPTDTSLTQTTDSVIGDAPQSPAVLTLIGGGKIGILSFPNTTDFNDVIDGKCKVSVFFAANTGNDSLIIESYAIAPPGFTVLSPTFPLILEPDSSVAITIQYCSTDTGSIVGTLIVETDVPSADTDKLLAHTGIGILSITDTIDFDSVAIGGCADTLIQIKNVGTDILVLTPGTNFQPPFSYQGPSQIVLAPGASLMIPILFCPQDTSEASETTNFDTIGAAVNKMFTLRGKGIEGSLSTAGFIDLGCLVQGTSATITDTIRNTGAATLESLGAAITAGTIVHKPDSLAPGATDSVVLVIPATTLGPFTATLTLTWLNGVPVTVPITGQVSVPPSVTSLDTTLVFDSTNVGDSSVMECVQITNYSCVPEPLDSIFVSGGLAGEFEIVSNNATHSIADSAIATICIRYKPQRGGGSSVTLVAASGGNMVPLSNLSGFGRGNSVGVELAIDTVAGRPGDIVNVPVRTLNDVTAASIDSVTFRVSFNPMQLDLKAPIAPTVPSIQSSTAPVYTMTSYSIGDKEITAAFSTPLTGTPIIAELPFEILQPTANTAAIHLTSASFGSTLATLATTSDGLIQIEQCDTNDLVALVPSLIDVMQNNPNPFSIRAAVTVTVNTAGHLHLEVYNALGVKVLVPFDGDVAVGTQTIELDAGTLPSGAYHYITTWTWVGSNAPSYQPTFVRDEKTMILLGK